MGTTVTSSEGTPSRSMATLSASRSASQTTSITVTLSLSSSRTKTRSKRVPKPATRVPTRQPTTFHISTPSPPSTIAASTPSPVGGNSSNLANSGSDAGAAAPSVSNLGIGLIALSVLTVMMIGIGVSCVLFRRHLAKKKLGVGAVGSPSDKKKRPIASGTDTQSEISNMSDISEMRKVNLDGPPALPINSAEDQQGGSVSVKVAPRSPKKRRTNVTFEDDDVEYAHFGSDVFNGSPESYLIPHRQAMEDPPPEYDDEHDAADRHNPDLTELERVKRQEDRRDARMRNRELTFAEVKGLIQKYHPLLPNATAGNEDVAIAKKLSTIDAAEDRALRLYRHLQAEKAEQVGVLSGKRSTNNWQGADPDQEGIESLSELPWMNTDRQQAVVERELVEKITFRRNTGRDDASIMSDERTLRAIVESGLEFENVVGEKARSGRRYRPSDGDTGSLANMSFTSPSASDWRSNATSDRASARSGDDSVSTASPSGSVKKKKTKHALTSRAMATASNTSGSTVFGRGASVANGRDRQSRWCSAEEEELFQHSSSPMERLRNVTRRINMPSRHEQDSSSDSDANAAALRLRLRVPRPKYDAAEASFRGLDLERYDPDL